MHEEKEAGGPDCGFRPVDEEALRRVVREELENSIKKFTDEFYASVGKNIVRRAVIVVALVIIYAAYKFGVITMPPGIK